MTTNLLIQLKHDSRLGYPSARHLPYIDKELLPILADYNVIISFRPPEHPYPSTQKVNVHGCVRICELPRTSLIFYGIEQDSPLAPLILWDAAHFLPMGHTLTLVANGDSSFLLRPYFEKALAVEYKDNLKLVLRKTSALPAEENAGLTRWTFGIPVGPEDASLLNVVVKRILEFDFQETEILLCGRPGPNFSYWDKVRIVGEDIKAPPIQLARKKNVLAREAQFENLCILHDRVFLPRTFPAAVRQFGDYYPLTTFQSIYFDDVHNFLPRRYSDFHAAPFVDSLKLCGFSRAEAELSTTTFSPTVSHQWKGFIWANPLRHSPQCYPTGSLYLIKKSVWRKCQLDSELHWGEFEDVEYGLRANFVGIPSRVNPFALTQSIMGRVILSDAGKVACQDARGRRRRYRAPFEMFSLKRKPLLRLPPSSAAERLQTFVNKYGSYCGGKEGGAQVSGESLLLTNDRLKAVGRAIYGARVEFRHTALKSFVRDFETLVINDEVAAWRKLALLDALETSPVSNRHFFFETCYELSNQIAQRPRISTFFQQMQEFLPVRSVRTRMGTLLSAIWLAWRNGNQFFLPGGVSDYYRAIDDSTPYLDYLGGVK